MGCHLYPDGEIRLKGSSRYSPLRKAKQCGKKIPQPLSFEYPSERVYEAQERIAIIFEGSKETNGASAPLSNLANTNYFKNKAESLENSLEQSLDWDFAVDGKEILLPGRAKPLKPGWGIQSPRNREFRPSARNMVRRLAAVLEQSVPREKLAFYTLTLPGSTKESIREFAKWTGYIVNRLNTHLNDRFGNLLRLSVWEHQKRGALHLHGVLALPDGVTLENFAIIIQEFWRKILLDLSKQIKVDLFARNKWQSWMDKWEQIKEYACLTQPVLKSVSRYLSKYLSKGNGAIESLSEDYPPPSRWWSTSRKLTALLEKSIVSINPLRCSHEELEELLPVVMELINSYSAWASPLSNPFSQEWIGVISRGDYEHQISLFQTLSQFLEEWLGAESEVKDISTNERIRRKWGEIWREVAERREKIWEMSQLQAEYRGSMLDWLNGHIAEMRAFEKSNR